MNEDDLDEITVDMGSNNRIVIDKLFGSSVFMNLRITPDLEKCEWVIERETFLPCEDPEYPGTRHWSKWLEWCRIPAQFDWEFHKEE